MLRWQQTTLRTFLVSSQSQQLGEFFGGVIVALLSIVGGLMIRRHVRKAFVA